MRKIQRLVAFIIVVLLTIGIVPQHITGIVTEINDSTNIDHIVSETKIYHNATVNDDFADNRVIVVFNKETSAKLNDYSIQDFSKISLTKVYDLTQGAKAFLKSKDTIASESYTRATEANNAFLNLDSYNQVIALELKDPGKENVLEVIKILQDRDDILYVGPDYKICIAGETPNDEYYDEQWSAEKINLPSAWDITTGSSSILIGVVDTGIDGSHEDLIGHISPALNRDFSTGTSQSVSTPVDPHGHGTHVAGIIGACGNNSIGISGVCWNVQLVSLRVLNSSGYGYSSYVVQALDYATTLNIPIINCSLAWSPSNTYYNVPLNTAIANYPGLFVCASGNEAKNIDSESMFPATYKLNNLITVANTKQDDTLNSTSNYGASTVHLAAPGTGIYSCYLNNGYTELNGTSMAAPHVAGVAALIMSLRPDLSPTEIKELILNNVDKVDALSGKCKTGGRLNAYKAVLAATESQTMTGDVNGDGRTDMILSRNLNGNRALTVFMGKADGSFTEPVTTNSIRLFIYSDPAFAGDFNGDGFTDVIIHWRNGPENKRQFLVYASKGDGTFNDAIKISCVLSYEPDIRPCKFFVDDVNGDGKDDFIVITRNINNYYTGYVYKGTAQSPYLVDTTVSAMSSTYVYSNADTLHCGDFNGDGRADIVLQRKTSNGMRELDIFLGNGYGNLISGTSLFSGRVHDLATYPSQFFVSDVDGNGKDDFVVHWRNSYGRRANLVYLGKETSPYITDSTTNALDSMNSYVYTDPVFTGDINGDGRDDMVVHWATGGKRQLLVYFAKADGTYNLGYNYAMANASDPSRYDDMYFVEDVNGDGKEDFVVKWKSSAGYVCFLTYLGTANSGFTAAVRTEPTTHIPYYS